MSVAVSTEREAFLSLLETVLANSPVGFCFLDDNLKYVCLNESFAVINGQAPVQLLGRTVREETPEFALMAETALRRVLKTRKPVLDVELKFAPSSIRSETRYFLASFYPVIGSAGGVATIGAMVLDITDRKVAEVLLRESEERYRLLFDHSPSPIFVIRPDASRFVAVNEAAIRHYGYSREEFLSMNVRELRPEANVPAFLRDYAIAMDPLAETKLPVEGEVRHRTKDGTLIDVEINWRPIPFKGIYTHLILAHDITEKKTAQEKLKLLSAELSRSNTALEQFAFVASHDLREPVRTIGMFASLLKKKNEEKLDSESLDYLAYISNGAERMKELINDLLQYSEVGWKETNKRSIDLNLAMKSTLANLKLAIEECDAEVTHDVLPTVSGEATQLTQVFQNLIENAIKYRRKDLRPKIHVSVQRREKDWLFCVKDNGIGFEMQHATEIFDSFYRLHGKSEYKGSGLGLATCKRIVNRYGGSTWAESEPGNGASFYFTIPQDTQKETGQA